MKNKYISLILSIIIMTGVLSACSNQKNKKDLESVIETQKNTEMKEDSDTELVSTDDESVEVVSLKFENINSDGSFIVKHSENKDYKVAKEFTKENNEAISQFEWYMDPLCGDCIRSHKASHKYILDAIKEDSLEIHYHPLNYLSHHVQKSNYSLVLSAWISGIADKNPEKVIEFISLVFDKENFRNKYVSEGNEIDELDLEEEIYNIAKSIGVTQADFIKGNLKHYEAAINSASVNIRKMPQWEELSPKEDKSFFVPFIYNVKTHSKALLGENEDAEKHILGPLKGIIDCNDDCE